jgi:hypothetical protein
MSNVTLSFSLPSTRTDNSALALTEIASFTVTPSASGGTVSAPSTVAGPFTTPAQTFVDNAPDMGNTVSYAVVVTDTQGNASAAASASVVVPPTTLAAPSPVTGLTATFNP